jgi:uncharacterized protein YjbJ (UPF0337 family)
LAVGLIRGAKDAAPPGAPEKGTFSAAQPFSTGPDSRGVDPMDKEHIKGAADKAKGAFKDAAGKMTGDKQMQVEGKFDKAKGAARQAVGDVKDAARKADQQADKP